MNLVVWVEICVVLGSVAGDCLDGGAVLTLWAADDGLNGGIDGSAGGVLAAAEAGGKVAAALVEVWETTACFWGAGEEAGSI